MSFKKFVFLFFALSCTTLSPRSGISTENYERQTTDASCSVAATSMIINQMLPNARFSQFMFFSRFKDHPWAKQTEQGGNGVTLSELPLYINDIAKKMSLSLKADYKYADSFKSSEDFGNYIFQNTTSKSYILVNFDQGTFFNVEPIGHFAIINSIEENKVTLVDPDNKVPMTYSLDIQRLYNLMKTIDPESQKLRGIVIIRRK